MNSCVWGNEQKVSVQGHPSPHPLPWHAGLVLSAASHPSPAHAWHVQILPQMPGTPSNNSGPFAATFFLSLPSPEKLLESQLGGNKSLFLPIPPHPMSHADSHVCTPTHTHTHTGEVCLGFHWQRHKLPRASPMKCNYGFILRSLTLGPSLPSCFLRESMLGLDLGLLLKSTSQAWGQGCGCHPKHQVWQQFPTVPVSDCTTEWSHTWLTTRLSMLHSTVFIIRPGKYRSDASRTKYLTSLFRGDQTVSAEMGANNTHRLHLKDHFPELSLGVAVREITPL